LTLIADTSTPIPGETSIFPGGNGDFAAFGFPSTDGHTIAFFAAANAHVGSSWGLYTSSGGTLAKVADWNTFQGFGYGGAGGDYPSVQGDKIAFTAVPFGGTYAVCLSTNGTITGIASGSEARSPTLDQGAVAYEQQSNGVQTVYVWPSGPSVASNSPVPGGTGTFGVILSPELRDGLIVFHNRQGVYTSTLSGTLSVIADTNTPAPDGGTFNDFVTDGATSGGYVAFTAKRTTDSVLGVYTNFGGTLSTIADRSTQIPDGSGPFSNFGSEIAFDQGHVAFLGVDATGTGGIYTNATGVISKVISDGDALDGKIVAGTPFICPQSLSGDDLVLLVHFTDGSSGIYEANLAPITFGGFLPPLNKQKTFEAGQTLPIKFQLFDTSGQQITSVSAVQSLQIQPLDAQGKPLGSPFTPASSNGKGLVYGNGSGDGDQGDQFTFNWKTKGLKAGLYQIVLTLADGSVHTLTISLKK
jgi:hypothetical protein